METDVEFDEFCDPNNPKKIKYDDIVAASRRIVGNIVRTPCAKAHMSEKLGMDLYLKQEFLQFTGCFKERGVRNALMLLSDEQKKYGVIAASTGNHGIALSYHAQLLGIPCVIVLPVSAPMSKANKCELLGARVIIHGACMKGAKTHAMTIGKDKKMLYINGYDHPNLIEGQGSVGIEIIEQVPGIDAVLIPVGGGSLLAGVAIAVKHLKPDTEIYGIETDKTCSMMESLRKNERVTLEIESTIADELGVGIVGVNAFHNVKGLVDKMIVVKEDWVARAIMHVVEEEKFVVEGGGAVPVAAIMAGLFPQLKGKKVACILSGGNIDTTILAGALERGMSAEGRNAQVAPTPVVKAIEFDPMCDKENPQKIAFEDVSAAAFRIQSGIVKTPCVKSQLSEATYGMEIYLKNDFLQYTGSFKERGARNALLLLSSEAKQRGVISASLGNHSQGLSYHANLLAIPATVVMPKVAPIMKIQKCRLYKANVIIHGDDMKEAKYHAMILAKERNLTYINGYDHPHIMAGQGTVGLEILEQVPDVDAVLVPVGGGGLIAGVATAVKHLKPHVLIYGVETEKCPSMQMAMKNDCPVSVEIRSTLADGLAVPTVGYNAFRTVKPIIDKMITVDEDWIARAILRLAEQEKFVVEGGGAVGVAAIMAGLVPELAGKKVVCILSGGNIDTTILGRCLERGLAAEDRLIKFKVTVSDRPGGIAELCRLIASIGVSIKDIMQERAWVHGDIFSVSVKVVCETRGPEHLEELRATIAHNYKEWFFDDKRICERTGSERHLL